ncbi:type II toxin-antitoxin system RelE/ParE family toxin [Sulfurimonas sp.]|uniref:type II toxin-antitoxin system RelE/ParE family toxin n=1 Tax=Sulfurimonas sp. TaxID=2022749 RepID=UPI0025F37341|nr:type II toxin-antitoxin system RelE/ParE family toxin [Sulfurimonas sp.]MDD5158043.1 type II toxin-antitoxin system RelE/ParE family toxin [Sulfurimonas sp.]
MKITRSRKFQINLLITLGHIATDKVSASRKFQKELDTLIKNIPNFPYKYRQSIYFNDKDIRDLTYEKHTINYEVNLENNTIEILNIFNQNKPKES